MKRRAARIGVSRQNRAAILRMAMSIGVSVFEQRAAVIANRCCRFLAIISDPRDDPINEAVTVWPRRL
jgi:hypothetical protein